MVEKRTPSVVKGKTPWAGIVVGVGVIGTGLYFLLKGKPKTAKLGDILGLKVVWQNRGSARVTPEFRCDLKKSGTLETWEEGEWLTASALEPGKTETFEIFSVPIPSDWKGTTIDMKLVARIPGQTATDWLSWGTSSVVEKTVWSKDSVFKTS